VTRSVLVLLLCALVLGIGLFVTVCQADNHARARRLAECQRLCEMIEAGNAQAEARARAHLPGEAPQVADGTRTRPIPTPGAH
jgi:hypothetical protein